MIDTIVCDNAETISFGEFFKQKRIALGMTLRCFCRRYGYNPGNISKLERSRVSAPQSQRKLDQYMEALELASTDRNTFVTLAAISAGKIPEALTNKELAAKLPLLLGLSQYSIDDLKLFAEWLRERL